MAECAEQHDHGPKLITESQLRELRGKFFTVRHDVVKECGHKIDRMNEPSIGCEWCWWTWFSGHGELIKTTDEALQEHGPEFVIKLRGRRYLKYFLRFMSTLARFKKEQEQIDVQNTESKGGDFREIESNQGHEAMTECFRKGFNGQASETQSSGEVGGTTGQAIRDEGEFPKTGESGPQASPAHPDEPCIG